MSFRAPTATLPVTGPDRPFLVSEDSADPGWMEPADLPADWILEGSPSPRMRMMTCSQDFTLMSGIWHCSAGRFYFHYNSDETVHLISGGVTVTVDGHSERLGPGSSAFFPRGIVALWEVDDHVHKYFVQRTPGRVHRVVRGMSRLLPGIGQAAR